MLRTLDNIYRRCSLAWSAFKNPDLAHNEYVDGLKWGKVIAFAEVNRTLILHDPEQFQNQHFKMGYYYAADQVKAVMPLDEDRDLD